MVAWTSGAKWTFRLYPAMTIVGGVARDGGLPGTTENTMSTNVNPYQQPIGPALPGWTPRARPQRTVVEGTGCRLEPLDAQRHEASLYQAFAHAPDGRDWTYMTVGPFEDRSAFHTFAEGAAGSSDPLFFAVIDKRAGRAVGALSLMRIDAANGVIEVGNVMFSPLLKQKPISTEAQYILMKHVFEDLRYRRYEWKCDSLNEPSRRTATRLGFQFEGIFRQALVYKGRSRDTAWYSVVDSEWPRLRDAFEGWLAPGNFDAHGKQLRTLEAVRGASSHDAPRAKMPERP